MSKVGIFAGTFDPIHEGHISFAKLAADALKLNKVVFMLEKSPRYKKHVTDLKLRQQMLELAIAKSKNMQAYDSGEEFFSLGSTMELLRERFPGSDFVILLGSDTAQFLNEWQGIEELEPDVSFFVALREGVGSGELLNQLSKVKFADRLAFVDSPSPTKAASQIRTGKSKTGIAKVDKFIAANKLYKN